MQFDFVFFNWHHLTHSKLFFFLQFITNLCLSIESNIFVVFIPYVTYEANDKKKCRDIGIQYIW